MIETQSVANSERMSDVLRVFRLIFFSGLSLSICIRAEAVTTIFFNGSQATNFVSAGTTSDTISSEGYLFTYTRDKLFTGGVGLTNPVGRYVRVFWPSGLEAQAVTTGPNLSGGKLTITRQDGQPFSITTFTAKLLGNTAGAGAAFEIMPKLNGEDAFPDPFMYQASGYYGQDFTHITPQLTNFESYTIKLYVDFALMNFTAVDASAIVPATLQISAASPNSIHLTWPTDATGYLLQQKAGLSATNWTIVTNLASIVGTNKQVTISPVIGNRCFRLVHP